MQRFSFLLLILIFLSSCEKDYNSLALVPMTADENLDLPSIDMNIANHIRKVHYRTFGDPSDDVLFIIQGGLGSDFRRMIPLAETFSNDFYVVLWDPRGCGLSERVTEEEVSFDYFIEELHTLKGIFSPNRQISIIGESWGGVYAAMYTNTHVDEVKNLAFIEAGAFRDDIEIDVNDYSTSGFGSEWVQSMLWNQEFISPTDHEEIDYKWLYAWKLAVGSFFCDPDNAIDIPIW